MPAIGNSSAEARRRAACAAASAAIVLAAGLGLPGCAPAPSEDRRPGVLIVVVDALRSDRVGAYGCERGLTPVIDTLAADPDAVVFRRHYAQGTATKTSTASLFTGLFAFQHGVVWGHEMEESAAAEGRYETQVLGDDLVTLAERFGDAGFETFAAVKSHHLVAEYGFAQGFDVHIGPGEVDGDGGRVRAALEAVREASRPFFGYVHLAGVHHPFRANERDPEVMARLDFPYDEAARAAAGVDFTTADLRFRINEEGLRLERDDVRFANLLYDASTRHVDRRFLAPLIDGLKASGRYDDLLIVLTADHGEELYDHGGWAHGHALWDEVIRVPLVVKFPKGLKPPALPRRVDAATQAIDLAPSLLSYLGHTVPGDLPGTDVFLGVPRDSAYCELRGEWMLADERYKLIDAESGPFLSLAAADPGERVNLAAERPDEVQRLRDAAAALRQWVALRPREAPVLETLPDEEAIEALRSLGYVR